MTDEERLGILAERVINEMLAEAQSDGKVTVHVTNTYTCGRESESWVDVPGPPSPVTLDDDGEVDLYDWWDLYVHDHMGDGHQCGSSEHALYEATIVDAPGRDELTGLSTSWEG